VARFKNPILIGLAALGVFVIVQRPAESGVTVRDGVLSVAHGAQNLVQFAVQVGKGPSK
jgi:hypothetical protein